MNIEFIEKAAVVVAETGVGEKLLAEAAHAMDNGMRVFNIQYAGKSLYGMRQVLGLHEAPALSHIPAHLPNGNLEAGLYQSQWQGFVERFGTNEHRVGQLQRVEPLFKELKQKGLDRVYVGGSFVTTKAKPDDIDFVAGLKLTDSTALWKRVSDLTFVPKEFGEHAMLAHADDGINSTNMKLMRFNRTNTAVGVVRLELPH